MSLSQPTPSAIEIDAAIDRQIDAMNELRDCLEAEHRALQIRDAEVLVSASEQKDASLIKAAKLGKTLASLLDAETDDISPASRAGREQLDTLTRTCRDLNDANGSLIRRQKMRVETTLHILRGTQEQPAGYDPSGKTTRTGSSRILLGSV